MNQTVQYPGSLTPHLTYADVKPCGLLATDVCNRFTFSYTDAPNTYTGDVLVNQGTNLPEAQVMTTTEGGSAPAYTAVIVFSGIQTSLPTDPTFLTVPDVCAHGPATAAAARPRVIHPMM